MERPTATPVALVPRPLVPAGATGPAATAAPVPGALPVTAPAAVGASPAFPGAVPLVPTPAVAEGQLRAIADQVVRRLDERDLSRRERMGRR